MSRRFQRPRTKAQLEDLEVRGFWKAISLSRRIGESKQKITLAVILGIHKEMFKDVFPEIAGRFRIKENIKKLKCIEPPLGEKVQEEMYKFWREFDTRIAVIPLRCKNPNNSKQKQKWFSQVIDLAAWTQHKIAAIHPFCEGNGRMSRLVTNIILRRFDLKPSQVRYEGEDKQKYLEALCQIDYHENYDCLKQLIVRGVLEEYRKEQKLRMRVITKRSR